MNNQTSYCGLVDAKIRTSDKDLPVRVFATNFGLEVLLFSLALFLAVADEFDLLDLVPDDLVLRNGYKLTLFSITIEI